MEKYKIGIDIGGSHIGVGLLKNEKIIDIQNTYILKEYLKEEKIIEFLEQNIIKNIEYILEKNKLKISDISQIGVACPGDIKDGVIYNAHNLNIKKYNISSFLKNIYNMNIRLKNDGLAAALAEKKFGSLKKYSDAIFLCVGSGIGSAVFLNGEILKCKNARGFEIGHMLVSLNGKQCSCKKSGCFERYGSISALREEVKKVIKHDGFLSLGEILEEYIKQEEVKEIVDKYILNFAKVLISLTDIFEVEAISLGGGLSNKEDNYIINEIKKVYKELPRMGSGEKAKIITATFKNEAAIIGSLI